MKRFVFFLLLILVFSFFVYNYWDLGNKEEQSINIISKQNLNQNVDTQENLNEGEEKSEFLFPWKKDNLESYEKPKYRFKEAYGEVVSDPEWTHLGEIGRRFDKETQQRFAKIKGYAHYFEFSDFGVIFGTNNPYDDTFVTKNPKIFRRYFSGDYDVLYTMSDFYVQKFEKDINQNFDIELLKNQHLVDGWLFNLYEYGSHDWDFLDIPKDYLVYSLDISNHNKYGGSEANDVIYFIYNPDSQNKYYKFSWKDGCAPSCELPTYFRISLN